MAKAHRKFTKEEEDIIARAKARGSPDEEVAMLLGCSESHYRRIVKKNAALRERIDKGVAMSNLQVRQRLFDSVMGKTPIIERTWNEAAQKWDEKTVLVGRPSSDRMLEFYCKTRLEMGFPMKVEHSGPRGGPIATTSKTSIVDDRELTEEEILNELVGIKNKIEAMIK